MSAYYNEVDPYAAQWLRNLSDAGHIAPGVVDERDIRDVRPDDLGGFTQCHFFAGIGVWSGALRQAGWPDARPVWTGSCPCQPFSAAGRGKGTADERHLWPHWHHLIAECRPANVFGEQVSSKDGLGWFDLVSADMEGTGYAIGALDTCAAGVGAPHWRQRLYFAAERLADADGRNSCSEWQQRSGQQRQQPENGSSGGLADAGSRRGTEGLPEQEQRKERIAEKHDDSRDRRDGVQAALATTQQPGPVNGFWRDADWLKCRDGKWRPVEPGTFPLAHGVANRVGKLRAYGNAINLAQASEFIAAYTET